MTYLLQVSTCWIVFYGIYLLFLRKETFFRINRYYLLGTLVTGLVVPFLGSYIPANEASVEVYQVMNQFSAVEVLPQVYKEEVTPIFTWANLLWAIYIMGGIIVFSRFLYGLNRIYSIYKESEITPQNKYTLVESEKYHLPFSFFHFIFISKQLPLNSEVEKVLRHEELHANQWHSIDIVFTELLQVFFWFNPILIMYKGALRQSHEYLADAYVTQDHNKNSYGQLLLQQSTSGLEIALANQFFHSQIKKRITMMYKEKSKRSAMVKYLAAVPVLIAMLLIFSSNQIKENETEDDLLEQKEEYTSLESEIKEKLVAKGIDIKNIDQDDPIQLKEIGEALTDIMKSFDFDIRVEKNGDYTFPPTDKRHDDIREYFKAIKAENRSAVIKVNLEVDSRHITSLLNCAQDLDLEVILNDVIQNKKKEIQIDANKLGKTFPFIDPELIKSGVKGYRTMTVLANGAYIHDKTPITDQEVVQIISLIKEKEGQLYIKAIKGSKWGRISNLMSIASSLGVKAVVENLNFPDNFDGRRITQRNWEAIVKVLNKADGKVVINAEANADGKMVYVEVDSEKSTITDKDILKKALAAAKGYRIEKGEGKANGTLIFNFSPGRNTKNYHDEYINQYNYGQSNENKSMLDHINEFTKENQGDPIFKVVEEMPRFPGCEDMEGTSKEKEECAKQKMLEFVYSNLKYPTKARDKGVEGICVVGFVIEKNGAVTGAKLARNIGADCGIETMKVINKFPNWIPGKQSGMAVRVQYMLPVKFKLESSSKEETVHVVGYGENNLKQKKENLIINTKSELPEDVFKVVQEMPRFPGCEDMEGTVKEKENCSKQKMLEYIYSNIKYPKEARSKGIDGMSVIRMVIEKDGSVTNVSTLRDPGAGTGDEAARVTREMPKWIPGKQSGEAVRVQYVLPVKFKLEGDTPKDVENILQGKTSGVNITNEEKSNIVLKTSNYKGPQPLIVIDGKIKPETSIEQIKPDDIKAINVLKGEKALEKYGDKGENGVIEITMKNVKKPVKYLIDGQLFGEEFYNTIDKSHINKERPATKEEKFIRDMKEDLIIVNMLAGYGFNSAYFPGTNTEDGSNKALLAFVGNNIKYPRSAIDNKIEGVVTIRYTVEADGSLTNFNIGKSLGWGLDQAVIEMMEKLADEKGLWKAAYLDRRSVASSMVLPVKFKLQNEHKEEAKSRALTPPKFSVSPNPSNGNFNIEYQLDKNLPANLTLYNSAGKIIKKMLNLPAENRISLDLSNQNTSIIYISLEQDGKVKTIKASIQK